MGTRAGYNTAVHACSFHAGFEIGWMDGWLDG